METRLTIHEYRIQQWSQIIQTCRSSGMTVNNWCAENGIHPKSYYYWLRKMRTAALEQQPTSAPFVQIGEEKREEAPGSGILLRVSGCEVEIREGTSTELIERALQAIRHAG